MSAVSGPQERVTRHTEQIVDSAPGLSILHVPLPQMVHQLVDVLKIIDMSQLVVVEQVIEVPRIILQDRIPPRTVLRGPQLAEKLVEVPTVVSQSFSQQLCAEQNVDIPVPRGLLDGRGLPSGQSSTARCGRSARFTRRTGFHSASWSRSRSLAGFLVRGQSSTALRRADVEVFPGFLVREQSSTALRRADVAVYSGFPIGQGSAALGGADHRGQSAVRQSSPPASERDSWVDGDDVWVRTDTAQGPYWCREPLTALVMAVTAVRWSFSLPFLWHRRQHGLPAGADFVGSDLGCDWFLLVALGQEWFWRVWSSFRCAVEEFVESLANCAWWNWQVYPL